jgi:predicted Rossmann fold flavoprotein
MNKKLIVIGGGAAGFFCALTAARIDPQLQVTILEKTNKLLSKVRVSGGGRCNVTHACFEIEQMIRKYPRGANLLKKAFHQFFTTDTIKWFEAKGVQLKTEDDGRMFPVTNSSQTIINCLMQETNQLGIGIVMNAEVQRIVATDNNFQILLSNKRAVGNATAGEGSEQLSANFICVATGGYPKATMFDWLSATGHSIEPPVPSLFTFNTPGHPITKLMGVSVPFARVKIVQSKLEQEGPLLITHWGLSGPAVLKLSAWGARELAARNWNFTTRINWTPHYDEAALRKKIQSFRTDFATQKIGSKNSFGLPQRLWEYLLLVSEINAEVNWADLPARFQNKLIQHLLQFEMEVKGKTTFKEEFVTAGGINLSEIDANTMMSKKVKNLFFAGEVMDVDGITGGFNFQHAWTSGFISGKSIASISSRLVIQDQDTN